MQVVKLRLQTLISIGLLVIGSGDQQVYSRTSNDLDGPKSCHLRELELCLMGLVSIFQNPNGLPMSQIELKRQCEYFNESVDCLKKYSDQCVTHQQFGIAYLFIQNSMQLVTDFCRPDSQLRTNYTKHVECYREVQNKYQRACLNDFQVGFEGLNKMNRSERLSTACCNINRLNECFLEPVSADCGEEALETIENLLLNIFGTLFSLPCRKFDSGNPDCRRLLPIIGTKPHNGRNTTALSQIISGFTNVPSQK